MALLADHRDQAELGEIQRDRLTALIAEVLPGNRFYARKFTEAGVSAADIRTTADLRRLPFTTKSELLADQERHPPYGEVHAYPRSSYVRLHQTSGTAGRPLRWLDTRESWDWCLDCWRQIYEIIGLRTDDCLFFPFSFGPFLGFWTAFESACQLGNWCLPAGGMSSGARLRLMLDTEATIVLCTPTYALRLAEVAAEEGIDLATSGVRALIVAGEPGGSIPATRERIERAWGARVFDHSGMTEAGPLAVECLENPGGLHLLEGECAAEIIDPNMGAAVSPGTLGELVLTTFGRPGSPLIRYRTGDLVRADPRPCPCGRPFLRLDGGILGRTDDMISVRGNNVYPGAIEAVIRRVADVAEYRVVVDPSSTMAVLRVEVEPTAAELGASVIERVDRAIRDGLLFRAEVSAVAPGSLPRFEFKAQRMSRKDAKAQRNEGAIQ
jgi:phenylacetate-CoA ligase